MSDGFLTITGRKKEIIVTAGGKNVVPALLEDQIRADALVSQVLVVGDNRPFIGALVTLDEEALPGWLQPPRAAGRRPPLAEAADNPAVKAAVQELINHANQSVSQAEAIKSFRIVPADFTEASGHLTPSMKVKRAQVHEGLRERDRGNVQRQASHPRLSSTATQRAGPLPRREQRQRRVLPASAGRTLRVVLRCCRAAATRRRAAGPRPGPVRPRRRRAAPRCRPPAS